MQQVQPAVQSNRPGLNGVAEINWGSRMRLWRVLLRLTLDELHDLAFELGVEHTVFAQTRKQKLCRALVAFHERAGRLGDDSPRHAKSSRQLTHGR